MRAKPRIFSSFQAAHPVGQIAGSDLLALAEATDYGYRLISSLLIFGDQHRQPEVGFGLERYRESTMVLGLLAIRRHSFLSYTTIDHSKAEMSQARSPTGYKKLALHRAPVLVPGPDYRSKMEA
jgi:hypothetical protein